MLTAKKLIEIAETENGYIEKKSNSQLDGKTANAGSNNFTKYARDLFTAGFFNGNKNGFPWCTSFVVWIFYQLCNKNKKKTLDMLCHSGDLGAGCVYAARYYRNAGRFHTSPKVGDQIFFGVKGDESHTGIVYKVDGSKVYTIEGNTSGASGVVANGGSVCKKSYSLNYSEIVGYGRPKYDAETTETKPATAAKNKLTEDGKWGTATTARLQQIFGTPEDGVVSNQWANYAKDNPGLVSGFDWQAKPNGKGSVLIKAMQKWAGMAPGECDGELGPKTIKAFQRKLGTPVDGKVSYPSQMVKALQKWANKQ